MLVETSLLTNIDKLIEALAFCVLGCTWKRKRERKRKKWIFIWYSWEETRWKHNIYYYYCCLPLTDRYKKNKKHYFFSNPVFFLFCFNSVCACIYLLKISMNSLHLYLYLYGKHMASIYTNSWRFFFVFFSFCEILFFLFYCKDA